MKLKNFEPRELEVHVAPRGGLNAGGVRLWIRPKRSAVEKYIFEITTPRKITWSSKIKEVCGNLVCKLTIGETTRTAAGVELFPGAGDAVKNAFVNAAQSFGIGWTLTTLPEIFIPKEYLRKFSPDHCYDRFEVSDIKYSEDGASVDEITIAILKSYAPVWGVGEKAHELKFYSDGKVEHLTAADVPADTPTINEAEEQLKAEGIPANFYDQELLIGKNKGRIIKEFKEKAPKEWQAFLRWAADKEDFKGSTPEHVKQFEVLKALGKKL